MTMSHTASLAGAHHVASAFLSAAGVGQAQGVEAWLQALAVRIVLARLKMLI